MRVTPIIRLLIVFAVTFSLSTMAGPLSSHIQIPTIRFAQAITDLCQPTNSAGACSSFWYPAGPMMGTELATIYSSGPSEYTDIQASRLDFPDWPCAQQSCSTICLNPNLTCTAPEAAVNYFEIQFMLANNFWGCDMSFGNSACGVQIRQGIAHMLDKTIFAAGDANCASSCVPIDNPVPTTIAGGLQSPNPCAWDSSFAEMGASCVVGSHGGTAYHLANATGADGFPWLQAPGSLDLNAAAQHFVNALSTIAGCGTISFNSTTSVLKIPSTCTTPSAAGYVPTFFIRNDDTARLDLGDAYAAQVCYLFTGAYTFPCAYLNTVRGFISEFPGFATNPTAVNKSWWMYTAGYIGGTFFDSSLYFTYNSRFVDSYNCTGGPGCNSADPFPLAQANGGPCSNAAVATGSAADYFYLCNPAYDSISSQMEFAPCLGAPNDPQAGQTAPTYAFCPGTTSLSARSAGYQTENLFGQNAFTIPVFETTVQYAYCSPGCGNWANVVYSSAYGLPNHFLWLNTWNPTPSLANTIRQGFAQTTTSLNPYIASSEQDSYIVDNIYDSLYASNPLNPSQIMDWMTINTSQLSNSSLTYIPPTGTVTTYRFTLIPGLTFQDGSPVTAFDVAFSYLSLLGTGAFQSGVASNVIGMTVLGPRQFDFNLNATGFFTTADITGLTIMPGKDWVANPSNWNNGISTCTRPTSASCYPVQYGLTGTPAAVSCKLTGCGSFPANNLQWDLSKVTANYSPLSNGILMGSGAWQCGSGSGLGGPGCSSSGSQSPPPGGGYTLTANQNYGRSAASLAMWIWASDGNAAGPSLLAYSTAAQCYQAINTPVGIDASTPGGGQGCSHWQQGIGGPPESTIATMSDHVVPASTVGTALSSDPKITFTGPTPFGSGDTIIYNVNGATTFQTGDTVIGCVSTTTCIPATPTVGTTLNSDPLLKFRDFPATGAWANGKSIVYDTDNSGGYDWGDVSDTPNSNSAGIFITSAKEINIPSPPPGGCPAVGVAGTTSSGCWLPEGSTQVGIVALRVGLNWVEPFNWATNPQLGIGRFPPTLYYPNVSQTSYAPNYPVLNPNSVTGCTNSYNATSTNSGTTIGGYDC